MNHLDPLKSLLATHDKSKGMGASNRGRHSDPKVDGLINEALATVDDAKRGKLLAQATELAIGENQGIIPLHYQVNTWATRKGLKFNPRADERTTGHDYIGEIKSIGVARKRNPDTILWVHFAFSSRESELIL